MTDKKSNKYASEKRDLHRRLGQDIQVILSGCLHHFEDPKKDLDEDCFDVDAIIKGRLRSVRQLNERRTGNSGETRILKGTIARGLFIPHKNIFDSVVNAHSVQEK